MGESCGQNELVTDRQGTGWMVFTTLGLNMMYTDIWRIEGAQDPKTGPAALKSGLNMCQYLT